VRRRLRSHIQSNVVGYVALFFALSLGGAWAATELQRNEVKSKHIAKKQVKSSDLAPEAVTSPKVANGSLLGDDFAPGQLPSGPNGATGPAGPNGATGPQGATGSPGISGLETVFATSASDSVSPKEITVDCPAGKRTIGTGAVIIGAEGHVLIDEIVPSAATTVPGNVFVNAAEEEPTTGDSWSVRAYAICAFAQ
jgi:hypothetical protein